MSEREGKLWPGGIPKGHDAHTAVEIHVCWGRWVIEMLLLRLCFEVSQWFTAMLPASNLR